MLDLELRFLKSKIGGGVISLHTTNASRLLCCDNATNRHIGNIFMQKECHQITLLAFCTMLVTK